MRAHFTLQAPDFTIGTTSWVIFCTEQSNLQGWVDKLLTPRYFRTSEAFQFPSLQRWSFNSIRLNLRFGLAKIQSIFIRSTIIMMLGFPRYNLRHMFRSMASRSSSVHFASIVDWFKPIGPKECFV